MLTSSAITREDYAKNPQAVLDVLEFYTDHQKREYEEYGILPNAGNTAATTSTPSRGLEPARFAAGTGFAGQNTPPYPAVSGAGATRPPIGRQDTAPGNLGSNGAASSRGPSPATTTVPQASRPPPHPPRPLLANRPAPSAPKPIDPRAPSKEALASRSRPSTDRDRTDQVPPPSSARPTEQRDPSPLPGPARPQFAPSKTAPATSAPESDPVDGPAGAVVGPPPVKPLHSASEPSHGVAAAAAALESKPKKPNEAERRISTLSEPQIMEKLRQVVSQDDPKAIYATIKKIGQGFVQFTVGV